MSARRLQQTLQTGVTPPTQCLALPASAVRLRKSGIEFRNGQPIPLLTEMTVTVEGLPDGRKLESSGVIVACDGNRHAGFMISMLFTGLTPQSQQRLSALARA